MKIISRAEWGAKSPKAVTTLPLSKVDTIVVHYTAAFKDETPNYKARVRETQNFHMAAPPNGRGWNDIAYNFLVSRDGQVFEGRGFGVQSASTAGANDHIISVCFLGSDKTNRDDVTDKGRKAIGAIILEIQKRANRKLLVKGHRDFKKVDPQNNTECPGDELYSFIKLKGWEKTKPLPFPAVPNWWWTWVAWRLGEGRFSKFGKANPAVRPANVPTKIPASAWVALAIFVTNRKG